MLYRPGCCRARKRSRTRGRPERAFRCGLSRPRRSSRPRWRERSSRAASTDRARRGGRRGPIPAPFRRSPRRREGRSAHDHGPERRSPRRCRSRLRCFKQGIRLLELARNAQEFYRTRGQTERAALPAFILPGSTLDQDRVAPAFKPPLDIIHRIAQKTRKAADSAPTACPTLLPRQDSNLRPKD